MNPSSYASLPERFFARVQPTRVAAPHLVKLNEALATDLNIDLSGLDAPALANLFSGNDLPQGTVPIAMAYAGHQFGHFVAQLGDGRAILIGEMRDTAGVLRDIQLKGCGRTPYSRSGDGRAALGPVLREYLVSEAMHALGIPATRSLAAVTTGESVQRETALPGAILTRVAASHVRVGTFEYFAARGDVAGTKILADYMIDRHYPLCAHDKSPYLALLKQVVSRQAALIAAWMNVGFIHGVMNTDNMTVSGETIDFGPCAFMDAFDPATVFSSIDERGRYAYSNQPNAALWNLARFAETLLPLIDADPQRAIAAATEAIATFETLFNDSWLVGMRRKLGLSASEQGDRQLAEDLLKAMHRNQADFTLSFRALCTAARDPQGDGLMRAQFLNALDYDEWAQRWRARMSREAAAPESRAEAMQEVNPAYIPRNHRVEQIIAAAVERGDFAPFEEFSQVLAAPYLERAAFAGYANPPQPQERVLQTFCGT
ncbi:MAG TPA: YdiU family protein [Steroidobacteraceae bacterium]|nr:YdiU family protein [Steroidobacteraceae bacterium]